MKAVTLAACVWLALAGATAAQQAEQLAAGVSTAVEGFGQVVAGATAPGETVFVTAIDVASWDRAGQAAVAEARRQAVVLARAAGRQIGEARRILMLTRGVQGDSASVTLAGRFALTTAR